MPELIAPHLLVVDRMSPRGGQELALHEYASLLAQRAPCVTLLPLHPGEAPEGGSYELLAAPSGVLRQRDAALASSVREHRRDGWVVQAFVPVPGAQLYIPRGGLVREALERRAASQNTGLRRWVSRHSYPHSPNKARLLRREREILEDPNGPQLVALSAYVVEQAQRHYALPAARIHRIPNGISLSRLQGAERRGAEWRARLGIEEGTKLFVTAAQNFRLKGVRTLVRAFERVRHEEPWSAVVAGAEGGGLPALCEGRLAFLGHVEDLPGLLCAADLVVHPTYYDPMSRVGLESLALGRPFLTTRFDGVRDLLGRDAKLLQDPEDPQELAQSLEAFLDHPWEPAVVAREALSMERHLEDLMPLLRRLEL